MLKITSHIGLLVLKIVISLFITAFLVWVLVSSKNSFFLISAFVGLIIFILSFAGIFAGIKDAKSIEMKLLAGFIGNSVFTMLLLFALFYVVLTLK